MSAELQAATPRVIAVIPAYNEARFIGSVVIATREFVHEVIVVDDGSKDVTADIAETAGATVIRLETNQGKGAALNAGFREAQARHPDAIVMLDGDAQHDPADIPRVVAPILAGRAAVVIGSRFLAQKSRIPWWRKIGQHVLTGITNAATGVPVTDSQSGFRAFSPDALKELRFHSGGLAVESEMQFLLEEGNLPWTEVPIGVTYRDGNKRNPVTHGLQILDSILGIVSQRHPLLFFGIPGSVSLLTGLGLGFWVLDRLNRIHTLSVGGSLASTVLLMVGLLLCITGVILHTVGTMTGRIQLDLRETLERRLVRHE